MRLPSSFHSSQDTQNHKMWTVYLHLAFAGTSTDTADRNDN